MLSRWLQRGRIGQILAPDPAVEDTEETAERSEFAGGLWSVIAPDPNFASPEHGGSGENITHAVSTSSTGDLSNAQSTELNSAYHVTPSKSSRRSYMPSIPQSPKSDDNSDSDNNVKKLVLSAAIDLASCVASPPAIWEDHKKFFNYCASATSLSDKQLRKVKKMLTKDPSLVTCRSSKMGFLIPDGFTPLHAVAYVGNYEVALILIDFCVDDKKGDQDDDEAQKQYAVSLNERDVQGRTALHIASEQGHLEIVKLLKTKMSERDPEGVLPIGEHAPLDLTGRTPLGWAATSRETMACKNRDELRMELFSPGDKSVFGQKTPALDRAGGGKRADAHVMDLLYGFAEMPGHRIEMEDAICFEFPLLVGSEAMKQKTEVGFFGVFDGHGDGGISSRYIADHIVQCLTATQEWKDYTGDENTLAKSFCKACSDIDVDLKAMFASGNGVRNGGTTGIMALITPTHIIVGNVGDSRCILVHNSMSEDIILSEEVEKKLKIEEESEPTSMEERHTTDEDVKEEEPKSQPQAQLSKTVNGGTKVTIKPLSIDHKPDLPEEKSRIENAGLKVIEERFLSGDNGKGENETTSIWKIQKSANEKIAVSRAFGDFDYKSNEDLKSEEQAIICVPEITIHERDCSKDMFVVLACDGVFDVMSNDEVGEFVANKIRDQNGPSLSAEVLPEVGDELLNHCLELGSSDNMSVLIVALPTIDRAVRDGATRKLVFADV